MDLRQKTLAFRRTHRGYGERAGDKQGRRHRQGGWGGAPDRCWGGGKFHAPARNFLKEDPAHDPGGFTVYCIWVWLDVIVGCYYYTQLMGLLP